MCRIFIQSVKIKNIFLVYKIIIIFIKIYGLQLSSHIIPLTEERNLVESMEHKKAMFLKTKIKIWLFKNKSNLILPDGIAGTQ